MKKCPKCKAEIGEEARFCFYCMTSFEEKQTIETPKESNKRWLIIIAAVLAVVLIVIGIVLFSKKGNKPKNIDNSSFINASNTSTANNDTPSSEQQGADSVSVGSSSPSSNTQTQDSSNNTTHNTTVNTTTDNTSTNNTTTNNSTTGSTSSNNKTETDSSENSSTTTPTEPTTVTYIYRDAKYGDDFSVGTNLENCVVITGVKEASANGEYTIPDELNGKKVVAVMGLAFCDESISNTVKTVVVPHTVKTIWNNAFANCYNLTDIYFCGNSIYTESYAFPEAEKRNGVLTIHCSANCSDRNYRYYKNSASYYDAEYEEWNG